MPLVRLLFVTLLFGIPTSAVAGGLADDDSLDTPPVEVGPWKIDLLGRLSATQIGSQNWAEGGANTLASTLAFESKIVRKSKNWNQTHETKLAVGLIKQDTLDLRKATDEIRLRSSFEYSGDGLFHTIRPTIASDISTQFAAGFNYKKNPFKDRDELPAKVSDFLAPATFVQTVGLTYVNKDVFKHRFGFGAKETVVMEENIRELYKMADDQSVRVELGLESHTHFTKEVFENVRLKTSLGLFAAFNKSDLPDLLWENEVAMKVNKWLGVRVEFKALYDRDVSSMMQLRESLSLGVSYDLI